MKEDAAMKEPEPLVFSIKIKTKPEIDDPKEIKPVHKVMILRTLAEMLGRSPGDAVIACLVTAFTIAGEDQGHPVAGFGDELLEMTAEFAREHMLQLKPEETLQ